MVTVMIGGILIDWMSLKITWKDMKTQTHPFTEADFKRLFVSELRRQGNTEVTFCHFLAFHMLSSCCQLSRWLPCTQKKATSPNHFIARLLCANILSIHSPLNYFPCGPFTKDTFCPLMLDWPFLCLTLFCVCSVESKVNFQSVVFLHFSYLSMKGWLSIQALF